MSNQIKVSVQNVTTQQPNLKKNSKNLNFKGIFIRNCKYKELINYAKSQDDFSKFRNLLNNLSQNYQSNLVLNYGYTKVPTECDYGGALKQGRYPLEEKTFVSISRKCDRIHSQQIYFNSDINPIAAAYQTILGLSNKESLLYKDLFEKQVITSKEQENSHSIREDAKQTLKKIQSPKEKKIKEINKRNKEAEKIKLTKEDQMEILKRMQLDLEHETGEFEDIMTTPFWPIYVVLGLGIPVLVYAVRKFMAMTVGLLNHALKNRI